MKIHSEFYQYSCSQSLNSRSDNEYSPICCLETLAPNSEECCISSRWIVGEENQRSDPMPDVAARAFVRQRRERSGASCGRTGAGSRSGKIYLRLSSKIIFGKTRTRSRA